MPPHRQAANRCTPFRRNLYAKTLYSNLSFFASANMQAQDSLVLTAKANANWLEKIKRLDKDSRLLALRQRLLIDTTIYISDSFYICGFVRKPGGVAWIEIKDSNENRIAGVGKPCLLVEGIFIDNSNKVKPSVVSQLAGLLTPIYIRSVELLKDNEAVALFGKYAKAGVFIIKLNRTKDKKLFAKFSAKQSS